MRIGVRLLCYPLAIGLIALAWHYGRAPAASKVEAVNWHGLTSQHQQIRAVTADGQLTFLDTHLVERCADGTSFDWRWFPAHFAQRGAEVTAHQRGSGRDFWRESIVADTSMQAQMGLHPRGVLRTRVVRTTHHGKVSCESGPVSFTLHS